MIYDYIAIINRDDEKVDDLINLDLSYDSLRSSKSEVPYSKQSEKTRCCLKLSGLTLVDSVNNYDKLDI